MRQSQEQDPSLLYELNDLPDQDSDIDLSGLPDQDTEPSMATDNEPPLLRKLKKYIFEPPDAITEGASDIADSLSQPGLNESPTVARLKGFIGGAGEGLAGLLSPANIVQTALPYGRLSKLLGAGQVASGADELVQGNYGKGLVDIASGIFGIKAKTPKARLKSPSAEPVVAVKPPIAEAEAVVNAAETLPELTPIQKVTAALTEAKPLRGKQERLYTAERQQRLGKMKDVTTTGEAGLKERLSLLKGEMPKVHFESIRPQIQQTDADELMNVIQGDKRLMDFEKLRAQVGLSKLLGEYGGHVPQENEILLLEKVFGKEFGAVVRQQMPQIDKVRAATSELINLPRAIQASMDLSAPFRQGVGLIHRKEWRDAWGDMVRSFGSQKTFEAVQDSIRMKPTFELSQEAGLQLTDLVSLTNREEQFMSNWAESGIPLPGKIGGAIQSAYAKTGGQAVKASNRAYVSFLNKLRSDTFDSLAKNLVDSGIDPKQNLHLFKEMASYVNTATGRGSLGKMERNAVMLNNLFFSPRLIASRVQMLNPTTYIKASPEIRKEYLKSLFAITTAGTTLTQLGRLVPGSSVESDPTSTDAGKLKIGNTRLDPYGGFQQYIVAASRLLTGEQKSSVSGKVTDLTAGKFGQPNRKDIIERFGRSKANPTLGFAYDLLKGKDFIGQPIDVKTETAKLFVPMLLQDIAEMANDDPTLLPFMTPLAATGMGVDTYSNQPSGPKKLKSLSSAGR